MAIQQSQWTNDGDNDSSGSRDRDNYHSYHSRSTAPTEYTKYNKRPPLARHDICDGSSEGCYDKWQSYFDDSRASTDTYASTISSEDEFSDDDGDEYEVDEMSDEFYQSEALASTPRDFAQLFPSHRRLSIHHDDATIDGNMNLRVDTLVSTRSGYERPVTLFHLRMRDLKTRDFSLRRYCRDSGREVCHSIRKIQKPTLGRPPILQKSFTDAISHFRHKQSTLSSLNAGYGSMFGEAEARAYNHASDETQSSAQASANTIKLEFGNYALVEIKRRGAGSQRRYCFEYWGHNYTWKRQIRREGEFEEVSYHLLRDDGVSPIAYIVPVPLTTEQFREEQLRGGWIPPCSMWICDERIISGSPDVAE